MYLSHVGVGDGVTVVSCCLLYFVRLRESCFLGVPTVFGFEQCPLASWFAFSIIISKVLKRRLIFIY